ncbi:10244_t:CDS:2, partial [Dentiscutata erythropus]
KIMGNVQMNNVGIKGQFSKELPSIHGSADTNDASLSNKDAPLPNCLKLRSVRGFSITVNRFFIITISIFNNFMELLKPSHTTTDPKNRLGKSFDIPRQASRKPTVITVPTYEEIEANVPKPVYELPPPKPLKPIPPPEPIPGATILARACAGRLDKEQWYNQSNPKSAPTWEEYIKMCDQSTRNIICSSIRQDCQDTDNLAKKRLRMPDNKDKTKSNFKIAFIKKWCGENQNDSDEDSIDENDDVCLIEPNEKYPININDFDHPIELDKEYPNDINDFDHPIELDKEYPNDINNFDHPIELDKECPNDINDFDHPIELDKEYPNDIDDFGHPIELDIEHSNDTRNIDHPIELDIEHSNDTRNINHHIEVEDNEFMNNASIIQKNNEIYAEDFSDRTSFGYKPYSGSSQESQEENDDYDELSNRDFRDGDEPPNKRQILTYDSNYTQAQDCNDDNVESIEYISDTENDAMRLRRRIKKTQLTITPDMDFFERLKIIAPEAAALYHEMEIVEESVDTDQANTSRVKTPYDNKIWFGKDTEKFYKLVAQWGYNYSKIADLTGRTVTQIRKKFIKENKLNFKRLDDAVRKKNEFSGYKKFK